MTESKPLVLQLTNLTTVFPTSRGDVVAVDGVNLSMRAGDILGLVGESGCGKSTVLLSILRLIRRPGHIADGEICFSDRDLRLLSPRQMREVRGRDIAMIFQDPLSTLNPAFRVGDQIRESLRLHGIIDGSQRPWPFNRSSRRKERERVVEIMSEVGIPAPDVRYKAYPHEFSGGMQQRALIAIALACEPRLILADEPTTALDVTIQAQILDLMGEINRSHGTSIILVTHDLGAAAEFCQRVAVMYAGRIVELGTVDQVIEQAQHPYTVGLLACIPHLGTERRPLTPISGSVPDLATLPPGCSFAPRCPLVQTTCETGPIPLVHLGEGHYSRCLRHIGFDRQQNWGWRTELAGEPVHE